MEYKLNLSSTENKDLISYCNMNDLRISEVIKKSYLEGFNIERYGLLNVGGTREKQVEKEVISNYALDQVEDLNDEEYDQIVRTMYFSRGNKEHWVVMTPYGQIRSSSKSTPKDLIVQIGNAAIELLYASLE